MTRKWALYLGRFFGIKVFIHWTFLILLFWIFIMHIQMGHGMAESFRGVLFILSLFACVVLHEFGHALTAKRFHIQTKDVTIYPIGGVASLEGMPEKPAQELLVALAGPAVNVAIAIFMWIYLGVTGTMPDWAAVQKSGQMENLPFAFNLLTANLFLVAFNLIPAFPMDGGRVLRAILAFKMDRIKATRTAAAVGQFLAIVFVFFGFFYNFWLVFIGLFVYLGAGGEANYEAVKNTLSGYKVKDVLMTKFTVLSPNDSLEKAVEVLLDGQEQEFLVAANGLVEGVLTRKELIQGLSAFGKSASISHVMRRDFITLSPETNLQEAYAQTSAEKCSVFPVMQDGKLVGMLDKENINEWILVRQAMLG